jgi:hypothetical protein
MEPLNLFLQRFVQRAGSVAQVVETKFLEVRKQRANRLQQTEVQTTERLLCTSGWEGLLGLVAMVPACHCFRN